MKFKTAFLAMIIIVPVSISCSLLELDSLKSQLRGQWEWVRSTGGFAGRTVTPDSAGYSKQEVHFKANNFFAFYRADTLVSYGFYSVGGSKKTAVLSYHPVNDKFMPEQHVEFNGRDTLVLIDRCSDCYTNIYIR